MRKGSLVFTLKRKRTRKRIKSVTEGAAEPVQQYKWSGRYLCEHCVVYSCEPSPQASAVWRLLFQCRANFPPEGNSVTRNMQRGKFSLELSQSHCFLFVCCHRFSPWWWFSLQCSIRTSTAARCMHFKHRGTKKTAIKVCKEIDPKKREKMKTFQWEERVHSVRRWVRWRRWRRWVEVGWRGRDTVLPTLHCLFFSSTIPECHLLIFRLPWHCLSWQLASYPPLPSLPKGSNSGSGAPASNLSTTSRLHGSALLTTSWSFSHLQPQNMREHA